MVLLKPDNKRCFIDCSMLTKLCGKYGTVDKYHPTDYGFVSMAEVLSDVMSQINISE